MNDRIAKGVTIVAPFFILAIGFLFGYLFYAHFKARREPLTPQVDTFIISTPKVAKIGSFRTLSVGEIKTKNFVFVSDTICERDTHYIVLPKEQRIYEKEGEYKAWVSGFEPTLDSLWYNEQTRIIKETYREPIKNHSIMLRGEMMYDKYLYFPITLDYSYKWRWGELNSGVGYDPYSKSFVAKASVGIRIYSW